MGQPRRRLPSAALVWAFLVPAYAILALGPRRAVPWSFAFLASPVAMALTDGWALVHADQRRPGARPLLDGEDADDPVAAASSPELSAAVEMSMAQFGSGGATEG